MSQTTRIDRVNILLVDDQPPKLLTYETILNELGENLIKASSASEALQCLLKNDIAVVLVDVCMPDLDGYELAAMIRQHPRYQKTSIIFVSAIMLTDLDRLRGYECGAVDYVPVPVVPEILRAKVSVFAELYRKTRALERLNEELEQRVVERTAALEASTEALREADRRKDEFLAMLAHELRNPLAPIRTAVQLLRLKELAESQRARARDVIERQVEHLVALINDLLDVSRITRGVIALHREPLILGDIVARAVEIARPAIDASRHELTIELPIESIALDGDRTQAGAGDRQRPPQRRQVHGAAGTYPPDGGARRPVCRHQGGRHGDRHRPGHAAHHLRAVHPGPLPLRAFGGRPGHRPRAHPAPDRDARRHGDRAQRRAGPRHRGHGAIARAGREHGGRDRGAGRRPPAVDSVAGASWSPTTTRTPPSR